MSLKPLKDIKKKPLIPVTSDKTVNALAKKLKLDVNQYNFAFAGSSGRGKSSLINGLAGFGPDDPKAAKTGRKETTMDMTKYEFRHELPHITLWDLL